MRDVGWHTATWLNRPDDVRTEGHDLLVSTGADTDFWRTTS
jgi:regulation of enolase protein 1 (concanavalin A-like superfamily)